MYSIKKSPGYKMYNARAKTKCSDLINMEIQNTYVYFVYAYTFLKYQRLPLYCRLNIQY